MQRYITRTVRKDIDEGNYLRALVQLSADLEAIFFDKLFFEKRINPKLIQGWTLGRFSEWVFAHDLIESKYRDLIADFIQIRNIIIHGRYFIHNTEKNLTNLNILTRLMKDVCDFIDETWVARDTSREIERQYAEVLMRTSDRYNNFFNNPKRN